MIKWAIAIAIAALVAGCGLFGRADRTADRFVRPGQPKSSPSGSYTAFADYGPEDHGVTTWVAVIKDAAGNEVFRDEDNYSSRHGVGITWLSTEDQLWLLSSDVGTAHVDRSADGTWVKTWMNPETIGTVPEEIKSLQ